MHHWESKVKIIIEKWLTVAAGKRGLAFSFLFLTEILGPLELARVSSKFQRALFTFARAEPQESAVVFYVHHACASWEIVTAERAFSWFWH